MWLANTKSKKKRKIVTGHPGLPELLRKIFSIKKRKWKTQSGMITLEAMFVFPVVFFLVITLCYMTFYLNDYVRLQGIIENYAVEEGMCIKDSDELLVAPSYKERKSRGISYMFGDLKKQQNSLALALEKSIENEKIIGKLEQVTVKISGAKIDVTVEMSIDVGIPQVHTNMGGSPFRYSMNTTVWIHNPEEFLRAYTKLKDTWESTKGDKLIKEKLSEINKVGK